VELLPKFLEEAKKEPSLQFVDANLKVNKPELNLTIDRDKASDIGVSVSDIARTLQIALGSQRFGYFVKDGKQYRWCQVDRKTSDNQYDLQKSFCRNRANIQLDL
jgi:multidrug efflux pump